jgi:hypothetical protein
MGLLGLGALNLKPALVCSTLSTTRSDARPRSTFFQRSPQQLAARHSSHKRH